MERWCLGERLRDGEREVEVEYWSIGGMELWSDGGKENLSELCKWQ